MNHNHNVNTVVKCVHSCVTVKFGDEGWTNFHASAKIKTSQWAMEYTCRINNQVNKTVSRTVELLHEPIINVQKYSTITRNPVNTLENENSI